MKPVKNENGTWDVVDNEGSVLSEGHSSRNAARDWAKANPDATPASTTSVPVETPAGTVETAVEPSPSTPPDSNTPPVIENATSDVIFGLLEKVLHKVEATHKTTDLGLTDTQADVLAALVGGPLGQKTLAQTLGCTGGNITMVADNLEPKGYITRTRGTEDRRNVAIGLTGEGMKVGKKVLKQREKAQNVFFEVLKGHVNQTDMDTFARILSILAIG